MNIGSARSKIANAPSGVRIQGSVLGPLLFVIFINDLLDVIRIALVMLYADDLKLSKVINCIDNCQQLQTDTDAVFQWSKKWLLPLRMD